MFYEEENDGKILYMSLGAGPEKNLIINTLQFFQLTSSLLIEPVGLKHKLHLDFYTLRNEFFFLSSRFHVNRSESISLVFLICLIISVSYYINTSYMYIFLSLK